MLMMLKRMMLLLWMALKDFRGICSWVNYHWQAEAAGVERGATEHIYMRNGYNYLEGYQGALLRHIYMRNGHNYFVGVGGMRNGYNSYKVLRRCWYMVCGILK